MRYFKSLLSIFLVLLSSSVFSQSELMGCATGQTARENICVNQDGSCTEQSNISTFVKPPYHTNPPCAPCGYYASTNENGANQACCKQGQTAYPNGPGQVVCFDANSGKCFISKNPSEGGEQLSYTTRGSASTICSQEWICQQQVKNGNVSEECKNKCNSDYKLKTLDSGKKICVSENNYECNDATATEGKKGAPYQPSGGKDTVCSKAWTCNEQRKNNSSPSGYCSSTQNGPKCASGQRAVKGICVNQDGSCTEQSITGTNMIQGPYTKSPCAPCGYYAASSNENGANQACCKQGQIAYPSDNGQVICFDAGSGKCYTSKIPSIGGDQEPYTAKGSASTICSQEWMCQQQSSVSNQISPECAALKCKDNQIRITGGSGNVTACYDNNSKTCYTPLKNGRQTESTTGVCERCLVSQTYHEKNGEKFCVDDNNSKCHDLMSPVTGYQGHYKGQACMCGIGSKQFVYPTSQCNPCLDGQKNAVSKSTMGPYCQIATTGDNYKCMTVLSKTQPQKLDINACQPCGKSNCCPDGQILYTSESGSKICLKKVANNRYQCLSYTDNNRPVTSEPACAKCGFVTRDGRANCPKVCDQGQKEKIVNGMKVCVTPAGKCFTERYVTGGSGTGFTTAGAGFTPTGTGFTSTGTGFTSINSIQVPYERSNNSGQPCYVCGYEPVSMCPEKICLPHQKKDPSGEFCVDKQTNECYNMVGKGVSEQTKYKDGACRLCGKYPDSICTNKCYSDQTEKKAGNLSVCVVNNETSNDRYKPYTCLSTPDKSGKQKALKTRSGACSLCGLYDNEQCPPCPASQIEEHDHITGKTYCVDNQNRCYQAWTYNGRQIRYSEGACQTCGEGQAIKHDYTLGISYCYDKFTGVCETTINPESGKQQRYRQSSDNLQPCYQCGLEPSFCKKHCGNEQTPHYNAGVLQFCTDTKNMCWLPLGDGIAQKTPYQGPECTGCGQVLLSACPNPVCKSTQTIQQHKTGPFCVDNTNSQCFSTIGNGNNTQRIVNGDTELHPCYPSGQYCPENSLSNTCAQVSTQQKSDAYSDYLYN
ncbi:MAG: hypothetical protein CMF52_01420 [Legionellales bacterium]|nr:hypothetical protein [Legionellales bacterium]